MDAVIINYGSEDIFNEIDGGPLLDMNSTNFFFSEYIKSNFSLIFFFYKNNNNLFVFFFFK